MASEGPIRLNIVVANPNGLHMRPATKFAQTARKYNARVEVTYESKRADGKSAMELVFLIAMPGAVLGLEIEGEDAELASHELVAILQDPGTDEY